MDSAWEKLQAATLSLARSGTIKERLTDACRNYLMSLVEEELPREIREDFRAFHYAVTREQPMLRGEDAVRATIRKMSNDEADLIASTVVRMFAALPRSASGILRNGTSAQVVPLYIAEGSTATVTPMPSRVNSA
jgi:hypothetical protein